MAHRLMFLSSFFLFLPSFYLRSERGPLLVPGRLRHAAGAFWALAASSLTFAVFFCSIFFFCEATRRMAKAPTPVAKLSSLISGPFGSSNGAPAWASREFATIVRSIGESGSNHVRCVNVCVWRVCVCVCVWVGTSYVCVLCSLQIDEKTAAVLRLARSKRRIKSPS